MPHTAVRAATEGDMPAVRAVAKRFGLLSGWHPGSPDFLDAERAFGTLLLAPGGEDGSATGFGGTLRRGGLTHLGDLFVLPARQSSGVGRTLLSRLLSGDGPKVTFASSDPRAMSLYVRHGLRPWCPLLYLTGPPAGRPAPPVRIATAEDTAALDADVSGGSRAGTLTWYAALPGVTAYTTDAGYAFTRTTAGGTLIGPAGGATPHDCVTAVLGALAATAPSSHPAKLAVPGPHPLVPLLLGTGWRIADLDTFMADDAALALIRADRYVPHPDLG
ncbi:GNAT family N-acetyltransferase [Nonomuraea sp. FMUSA5-5]|uniref:GNAT family N-acetyltransferase n=1 Tax=Nonomuraea composti TaxID=2720023 RepID=A0ABX1AUC2_9ACTN|nr:GNAT family N-acetyltransferase [Nonomuraea sp. FMUSA5-5]NJP87950.1 GNAT family N-acetyltransferase [Nonomuraea sp. FMUSA5-5]